MMKKWFYCLFGLLVLKVVSHEALKKRSLNNSWDNDTKETEEYDEVTASRGALAQGFEIHNLNLLAIRLEATGTTIFDNFNYEQCTAIDNLGITTKYSTLFSSTESLYSSILSETKIDASLKGSYTLGLSVSSVTNNNASEGTDVLGMSLNLKAKTKAQSLTRDCIRKSALAKDLINGFEGLDKEIKDPWKAGSWSKYSQFLKKYGSHIVKKVISGSSIYQYVFADSSKKFSERDFAVKACVSLEGPTQVGEVGLPACSGISKEEIKKSSKTSVVQKLVARGGTAKTRVELEQNRSPETISKFLNEGKSKPLPIIYEFYPIWQLLGSRYIGTEHYAKVLNLEQYYKGFLDFDCKYQQATNKKVDIQRFELEEDSDPEAPIYQCSLGPDSCHDNNDCHYRFPGGCACTGESCIRQGTKQLTSGLTKKYAYAETKGEVSWHGCTWKFRCKCNSPSKVRPVSWSGSAALSDMHLMMLDKNRDEASAKRRSQTHLKRHRHHST